ncbi:MAG: hypothetical protein J2P58_11485, partial [Acidimicrobiaceae bacterium]|nr:hypothetical protein [Acidimicrobiaceae bacterium]
MDRVGSGQWAFHRPARTWPVASTGGPIVLPAPPVPPAGASGRRWTQLLPMVGAVAMVGFVFVARSLVYLLVIGAMVVSMVAATLVTQLVAGRDQRRQWAATRRRYRDALERACHEADHAAWLQRAGLEGLYPEGHVLLGLARSGDGVWERRPGD